MQSSFVQNLGGNSRNVYDAIIPFVLNACLLLFCRHSTKHFNNNNLLFRSGLFVSYL